MCKHKPENPFNSPEFEFIKTTLNKLLYGKWWKCYTGKFSWCLFFKYVVIYFLFLLSYKVIFTITYDYQTGYYRQVDVIRDYFINGKIYSFEFVILSIVLMLMAFILLLSNIYSINQESVVKKLGRNVLTRDRMQHLDYKLIYRPRIVYHRLAWIFISSLCIIFALIFLTNNSTVYQTNMPDYTQKQNWIRNLPSLVKFGLPVYHRADLDKVDCTLGLEIRQLGIPVRYFAKRYNATNTVYTFIEYMLSSKIVTTNILMIFFYVDLFLLLPLFFEWINNKLKHISILVFLMFFSYLVIDNIIGSPEKLMYFNIMVIFTWVIAQVYLYLILNPIIIRTFLKYYKSAKSKVLGILQFHSFDLNQIEKKLYTPEFEFIRIMLLKFSVGKMNYSSSRKYDDLQLIKYINLYLPLSLSLIMPGYISRYISMIGLPFILIIALILMLQILLLYTITKKVYHFGNFIKEAYKLIEDSYKLPIRIIDYLIIYKADYRYNRYALLLVMLMFFIFSPMRFDFSIVCLFALLFVIIELMIVIPFILPFINTRLKHFSSILILLSLFILFIYTFFPRSNFGFLCFLVFIGLWIMAITARNIIISSAITNLKQQKITGVYLK